MEMEVDSEDGEMLTMDLAEPSNKPNLPIDEILTSYLFHRLETDPETSLLCASRIKTLKITEQMKHKEVIANLLVLQKYYQSDESFMIDPVSLGYENMIVQNAHLNNIRKMTLNMHEKLYEGDEVINWRKIMQILEVMFKVGTNSLMMFGFQSFEALVKIFALYLKFAEPKHDGDDDGSVEGFIYSLGGWQSSSNREARRKVESNRDL